MAGIRGEGLLLPSVDLLSDVPVTLCWVKSFDGKLSGASKEEADGADCPGVHISMRAEKLPPVSRSC